jgi:hypothetical protein
MGMRHGRRTAPRLGATALVPTLALLAAVLTAACVQSDQADRQAEVAERGAGVMPFDLDATTHHFDDRGDGLVQTVVADDGDDADQVRLIREHLAHEAERFAAGDLGDPASIHGADMPGLADLAAGAAAGDVVVDYEPTAGGARITYTADDRALVGALHEWSAAQVSDHGDHAEHADDPDHAED